MSLRLLPMIIQELGCSIILSQPLHDCFLTSILREWCFLHFSPMNSENEITHMTMFYHPRKCPLSNTCLNCGCHFWDAWTESWCSPLSKFASSTGIILLSPPRRESPRSWCTVTQAVSRDERYSLCPHWMSSPAGHRWFHWTLRVCKLSLPTVLGPLLSLSLPPPPFFSSPTSISLNSLRTCICKFLSLYDTQIYLDRAILGI